MKILSLSLSLLTLLALPSAALAEQGDYIGTINIAYVRGSDIKTVADERDKYERRKNRIGSGIVILIDQPLPAPVPHRKR